MAWYLCRNVDHVPQPGEEQIRRWRIRIRKWASRDRIGRYGEPGRGGRRYDLAEVMALVVDG